MSKRPSVARRRKQILEAKLAAMKRAALEDKLRKIVPSMVREKLQ